MSRDDGKLKAKAQLRAEAVERLRNCYYTSDSDLMRAMLNWGHEPHTGDDSRFALIGLLTDEEPRKFGVTAEQMAKASTDFFDKFPSINGKKADSLQDSREKLEAEIRYEYNGSISNEAEQIIEWLDRQAAITRTECERFCETCRDEQVDELQAQVLEMEGENEKLRMRVNELWGRLDGSRENVERLQAHADELTNQLDNAYEKNRSLRLHISKMQSGRNGWHVKAQKLEAENEQLREKLSRAYDNAHDTLRTM